jgi:hypothetical protein
VLFLRHAGGKKQNNQKGKEEAEAGSYHLRCFA